MNLKHEQVKHQQFGIGNIIEQEEKIITVEFSEDYGTKCFQYPLAFDKYLILCNAKLQDKMKNKAHLMVEQIEAERKREEEENLKRLAEERKKNLALKKAAPKRRAAAKSTTKKAPAKPKKKVLSLDTAVGEGNK